MNEIDCDCISQVKLFFCKIYTPKCVDIKNEIIQYRKNYIIKLNNLDGYTLQQLKDLIHDHGLKCPNNKNKAKHVNVLINHRNKQYNEWIKDYKYPMIKWL